MHPPSALKDLVVRLPQGTPLVSASNVSIKLGEQVLVSGPSGSGKSTLFRALAGIWPFGSGTITVPKNARVMMLPQRPYFPIAPLAAAVAYPADREATTSAKIAELISAVGLPALADRIEEEAHWNRMLSLGEQQRLGIARALLSEPDFLFLDEATASLDEPAEAALYQLLQRRLPRATIVSIGHRSTLAAFHQRRLAFSREGDHFVRAGGKSRARQVAQSARTQRERAADRSGRRPFRDRLRLSLLQAAERQVGRQLGDEGAPHQLDRPPVINRRDATGRSPAAVGSLVKALQSPLLRSVSK